MLDLGALRDTLSAALTPVPVAGAAEFAAIVETGTARAPALWMVPLQESAAANPLNQGVHQAITVTLGVVYAVRDVRDATGQAATASLSTLRTAVFAALINTTPDGATDPLYYSSGGLLQFVNGILFWQDQFVTTYALRVV